jgi:arsenite oxidase large subunit
MSKYIPQDKVPLPPPDAKVQTTACSYCIVACGYKVYTWPDGKEGGPKANQNALGLNFPTGTLGGWISPNQHNMATVDGKLNHVVIVPDFQTGVVNKGGNHSIRGGTLALKCYNQNTDTKDRLMYPQIRVNGKLTRVSWETAIEVMAAVSKHVLSKYGEAAWAMKTYSYEFWENTYAISKLAFDSIKTPAYAQHDKPSNGSDTGGVDDAGLITFSASYQDWADSDVIFISGTDPYETKSIIFTSWMMNKPKLIYALPRRTAGVAYAEANGGLFLQVIPGTDCISPSTASSLRTVGRTRSSSRNGSLTRGKWTKVLGAARATRLGSGAPLVADSSALTLPVIKIGCLNTIRQNLKMRRRSRVCPPKRFAKRQRCLAARAANAPTLRLHLKKEITGATTISTPAPLRRWDYSAARAIVRGE